MYKIQENDKNLIEFEQKSNINANQRFIWLKVLVSEQLLQEKTQWISENLDNVIHMWDIEEDAALESNP